MKKVDPRLVLLFAVMITGVSPTVIKDVDIPAMTLLGWRMIWTMLIMSPTVYRHRAEFKTVSKKDFRVAAIGGAVLAIHLICWFQSVKMSSVATSSVLCATEVIFAAVGFSIFMKGKIPLMGGLGIVVAFGGSMLLALSKSGGTDTLQGNVIGLLAGILVAGYTLISRSARSHMSTTIYTSIAYTSAFVVVMVAAFAMDVGFLGYGWQGALVSLYLCISCTFLGHTIFVWCLKWLSPSYVSAIKLCSPVFSMITAMLFLNENLTIVQVVAIVITLMGALLYTRTEAKQTAELLAAEAAGQ